MSHTIAAIATPTAPAGLGVVRLSGDDAIAVASRVFVPRDPHKRLWDRAGYTALYGCAADADGTIDDCVALLFRAPHSYTGEDTVELSCHGGVYLLQRVLRACLNAGARPAAAGEFTRRAFENGKMDLSQAESVMDLIAADGRLAAQTALAAREGALSRALDGIQRELLAVSAQLAAFVDYPDDDIPDLSPDALADTLSRANATLSRLLDTFDAGRVLREGVVTAIVGTPNVGKSTLMNRLAGCERSIVTDVAGTTRDIVEETVRLGEVTLQLSDTAGIRDTADLVEGIGVRRARERLGAAALVLSVFDSSRPLCADDRRLLDSLDPVRTVAVVNKTDRAPAWDIQEISARIPETVALSADTGEGLDTLAQAVARVTGVCRLTGDAPVLSTERQRQAVVRCREALSDAAAALESGLTLDAVNVGIDDALTALLELSGQRTTEAVVDEVFARFCVGK